MAEPPSKAPILARPAVWLGVGIALVLGLAWSGARSRVAEQQDDFRSEADASADAPPPQSLELPLHVFDPYLAHLRFAPDASAVLAFGSDGTALRSADDGQSWQA